MKEDCGKEETLTSKKKISHFYRTLALLWTAICHGKPNILHQLWIQGRGLISRFSLNDLYKEVIGGCGLKKETINSNVKVKTMLAKKSTVALSLSDQEIKSLDSTQYASKNADS